MTSEPTTVTGGALPSDQTPEPRIADGLLVEITRLHSGMVVITANGEVDTHSARKLDDAIARALADKPDRLIFDVSGVTFISSAGLSSLIFAARSCPSASLRNPSSIVRRVVDLMGLNGLLPIEPVDVPAGT